MRLEAAAVSDRELTAGPLHRGDHLLAPRRRDLHRLLAQHVLPRLRRLDRVAGMECVRRDDVHDVDVRIVRHPAHRVVVVDAPVRDPVLRLPLLSLRRRPGDDPGEPAVLRLLQRRCDLVGAQTAESDEREAELLLLPARRRCGAVRDRRDGAEGPNQGRTDGGERRHAHEVAAGGRHTIHPVS